MKEKDIRKFCSMYIELLKKKRKVEFSRPTRVTQRLFDLGLIQIGKDRLLILTKKGKSYSENFEKNDSPE